MSVSMFKKIDKGSGDSIPDTLNFFSTPLTQVAIEKVYEREFLTLNPIEESPNNFKVLTGASFIDPSKTKIMTGWTLQKRASADKAWENVAAKDDVGVINGFGGAFIRNLKITINGQKVSDSNNMYTYLAHDIHTLHNSVDAKSSSMNAFGYWYDNAGKNYHVPLAKPESDKHWPQTTKAWENLRNMFTDGKTAEFIAPLYADILQQPLFLPSNLDIDIEIIRHPQEFLIIAPKFEGQLRLKLESMRLFVTFVDLHPGVALEIEKKLATEPIKIPMQRTEMRVLYHDHKRLENHSIAFTEMVPREMDVFFLPMKNYVADIKTDPLFCYHSNLSEIQVRVGNNEVPHIPFVMDFEKERYVRAFEHLHRTIGAGNNLDCGITRKMFANGYTIFPFRLTASQEDHGGYDFIQDGPTIIKTKHSKEIDEGGLYVIIIGKFDSLMFIDITRTIRTDLTV